MFCSRVFLGCSQSHCDYCIVALMAFYALQTASTPTPFSCRHIPFLPNTDWCCPSVFGDVPLLSWNLFVLPSFPAWDADASPSLRCNRRKSSRGGGGGGTQPIGRITLDCEKCERRRCILQAEQPLLKCP